ncbi:MAG: heptose I phosphotransferase [Candidatus Azotimanducaceae bacterium]|jgi:heptose I phosphotransferase
MTYIAAELADDFSEATLINKVAGLEGETYREVAGRRTFRFMLNEKAYFAKLHLGVGWKEIFKNLFQFRLPVLGASNEWRAILRLQELDLETMTAVAYASEGMNPARVRSCLITESLEQTISLEELVIANNCPVVLKRSLLQRVGTIAKTLHENGVNHRDFYLCHFLLPTDSIDAAKVSHLYLIDLHRAQIRAGRAPKRWREKDIAGLLFSAADAGLTRTDLVRFLKAYIGPDIRQSLSEERLFWCAVVARAVRLYQKDHGGDSNFLQQLAARL